MSRLRPIDENFNETYANRGLQPTYQVIAEKRQIATDAMRGQSLIRDVRVGPQRAPIERAFSASSPRDVRITNRSGPAKTRVARKKLTRKAVVRQAKATSTCISILSWGMTIWTLQLWLALGSIVAFGAAGADHVVVGRPVWQAENPRAAAQAITREIGAPQAGTHKG